MYISASGVLKLHFTGIGTESQALYPGQEEEQDKGKENDNDIDMEWCEDRDKQQGRANGKET